MMNIHCGYLWICDVVTNIYFRLITINNIRCWLSLSSSFELIASSLVLCSSEYITNAFMINLCDALLFMAYMLNNYISKPLVILSSYMNTIKN